MASISRPTLSNLKRSFSSAFSKSLDDQTDSPMSQSANKQPKVTMYMDLKRDDINDSVESLDTIPVNAEQVVNRDQFNEHSMSNVKQMTKSEEEISDLDMCEFCKQTVCHCKNAASDVTKVIEDLSPCSECHFLQCQCNKLTTEMSLLIDKTCNVSSHETQHVWENIRSHKHSENNSDNVINIEGTGKKENRVRFVDSESLHDDKSMKNDACLMPQVTKTATNDKIDDKTDENLEDRVKKFEREVDEYYRSDRMGTVNKLIVKYDDKRMDRRKEQTIPFSMDNLRQTFSQLNTTDSSVTQQEFSRSFRATISADDNENAEKELHKQIHKHMFADMSVLGQFNLGFIIARLGDDLFIVDQHASDEKYNFEQLQNTVTLEGQKLISPQPLELTASNETILIDNLHIFHKNGFDIVVDHDARPTERLSLVSVPVTKNWRFGKSDIDEMTFMLTQSPGVMCRPSRVREMFASRACRKSIMIGTALDSPSMKQVLKHMGEIEQPWNCPHGRPTMRHLINLNMLPSS